MIKNNKLVVILIVAGIFFIVLAAILNLLTPVLNYTLVSTNIAPNTPIDIVQKIQFVLNKDITQTFFQTCSASTTPATTLSLSSDQKTLTIEPQSYFQPGTSYQLTLICKNLSVQTSFSTLSEDQLSKTSGNFLQTEKDYQFAHTVEQIYKDSPWQTSLPLIKTDYVLVYDGTKNVYIVQNKLPANSPVTLDQLKAEITTDLQKIGAPPLEITWR